MINPDKIAKKICGLFERKYYERNENIFTLERIVLRGNQSIPIQTLQINELGNSILRDFAKINVNKFMVTSPSLQIKNDNIVIVSSGDIDEQDGDEIEEILKKDGYRKL